MLNKERVKQLYKVALYEQKEEKLHKQTGKYYRSDYIGKEILKSIFTGTVAYLLVLAFVLIYNWEVFLDGVNQMDFKSVLFPLVLVYAGYMTVYLIVTHVIYSARYENSRKHLEEFEEELLCLHKMYEREEKIK